MIKRIHIFGGPGSGKTFLAEKLSERLAIQRYDLDDLFWGGNTNTFSIKAEPKVRNKKLNSIIKKKEWITEGVYGGWTKPCFKEAELIIILKPKTFIRQLRLIRRFLKRKFFLAKNKKKETFNGFLNLLKWSKSYYMNNFPDISKEIEPYEEKTMTITKPRIDVDEILTQIAGK